MEQILIRQVHSAPNATAVVDDDQIVSYRELICKADVLVDLLIEQHLEAEKPVCILVRAGLPQILAQIAVLRAGGTCVSVDPATPRDRLQEMLEDLATSHLITSDELGRSTANLSFIPIEAAQNAQIHDDHQEISVRADRPETHRSHIVFTSGSTGRPKPIQVLSSSILHVLRNMPTGSLEPSDRVSNLLTPGFDLSLLEIWKPLLEGATVIRVPDITRNDPFALQEFVKQQKITFMIVPTALFEVIALATPAAFDGVRHVIVGGEAVSSSAMRSILEASPPDHLWNGYGPAEATIFATLLRVGHEEVQRSRISIGYSFGDTRIILLDDELRTITEPNATGEICISGPQVSPGYLSRTEENERSFISVDPANQNASSTTPIRVYRTGDLAQWRDKEGGPLDYIGRADDQIKISGYRVELSEVSRMIEDHPQVHSCVVKIHQQTEVEYLEAYVIPDEEKQTLDPNQLIDWAKAKFPPYMVPRKVYKKRSFPLSARDKVDREALRPDDDSNEAADESTSENAPDGTEKLKPSTDASTVNMKKWLTSVLQPMLPTSSDMKPSDSIFSLGLSSLQAAQFIGRIRRDWGKSITLAQLHSHPTINSLADYLADSSSEGSPEASELERCEHDLKRLDDSVLLPNWQDVDEGRVFLTGTTGFLGAHVLQQLLCLPSVKQVACLARGQSNLSASARIQQTLEKYNLWDSQLEKTQKIMVLEGDLSDPNLGLGETQFTWLTNWASIIFHVGARVNWCEPYEAHFEPNVLGTRNIIRVASLGRRKPLHYVSSIDVWSVSGFINQVDRVLEDEQLMPHLNAVPYDTGYAASQFVAEELIQRARARGLPTAIYRPGFIIGHSKNAIANANDYFSRLIMGCIQTGYFPDLATQYLEYITVDYVASAVLHIASNIKNLGRAYHIVPPDRSQSVDYNQIHQMLRDLGYDVEKVDYDIWVEKVRDSPGTALEAMMPLLEEPVYEGMTRLQTSKNTPIYDPSNAKIALKDHFKIEYVALNPKLLGKFIENWVNRGEFSLEHHRKYGKTQ